MKFVSLWRAVLVGGAAFMVAVSLASTPARADLQFSCAGCVDGIRETTHTDPTYVRHEVIHYAVGNIPGAVPHTSTYALTNATLAYVVELAVHGTAEAVQLDPALAHGLNTYRGSVTHPAVAEALGVDVVAPARALGLRAE